MKGNRRVLHVADAGFTLLEVLIAVVVVGISAGTIAYLQRNTWASTRRSNNTLIAGQLIEKQVEKARMDIGIDASTHWPPVDGSTADASSGIQVAWTVTTTTDPDGVPIPEVRQIEYVASWHDSRSESLTVVTYLSEQF